jgi:tRNA 2-thiouridine synthesizing protein A
VSAPRPIDARGLLCPWPALRLARAAREMGGQGAVRLLADDPMAPAEIARLCTERGWACVRDPADPAAFDIDFGSSA